MSDYGACYDCGRRYGDRYGFPDLIVPHAMWANGISPTDDEGGLLCPSCMCKRAYNAGIECEAVFMSGPFAGKAGPNVPSAEAPPVRRKMAAIGAALLAVWLTFVLTASWAYDRGWDSGLKWYGCAHTDSTEEGAE